VRGRPSSVRLSAAKATGATSSSGRGEVDSDDTLGIGAEGVERESMSTLGTDGSAGGAGESIGLGGGVVIADSYIDARVRNSRRTGSSE
jgi:hypothetical protein